MDVNADENSLRAKEAQLSGELMSPFCPGRTLAACPTEEAAGLRSEIRAMFRAGKTGAEVTQTLVGRYGSDIRGIPAADGVGVLIWAAPLAFLFFSVLIVMFVLRRSKNSKEPEAAGATLAGETPARADSLD